MNDFAHEEHKLTHESNDAEQYLYGHEVSLRDGHHHQVVQVYDERKNEEHQVDHELGLEEVIGLVFPVVVYKQFDRLELVDIFARFKVDMTYQRRSQHQMVLDFMSPVELTELISDVLQALLVCFSNNVRFNTWLELISLFHPVLFAIFLEHSLSFVTSIDRSLIKNVKYINPL